MTMLDQVISLTDNQINGAITYMEELYPDGIELTKWEQVSKERNDKIYIPALKQKEYYHLQSIDLAGILHYVKMFENH